MQSTQTNYKKRKLHQFNSFLFDDQISKSFQILLAKEDNVILQKLINHFQKINRFKVEDYYYIKSLADFINLNNLSIQKSLFLNFLSTEFNVKYNKENGIIIGLNINKVSKILNKNRNFLRYFYKTQNIVYH